jgi:hypothetical protein
LGISENRKKEKKMSAGFGGEKLKDGKAVVIINDNEVDKLLKKYKKIKKYMKSPLFTVKTMDGTENYVSQLIKEAEDNPLD